MATGNSVHDEVKEQQQKLKGKPFKEKWAYFWEYYKIQTIVVIAVLAFAGNLIYTFATRKDTVMEAAFVNCYMNTEVNSDTMIADFEQYADIDTSSDCAAINRDMNVDYENADQYSYANMQKIIAMISGKTLDALITDDTYMDHNLEACSATCTSILPTRSWRSTAIRLYTRIFLMTIPTGKSPSASASADPNIC